MSIIDVTSGAYYATVSAAIAQSATGDVIDVGAGLYSEYFPKITHDLTIEGVGGLAQFTTPGPPTNGQGIFVTQAAVTFKSVDIFGATVPDNNGAGIRMESGTLTVVDSHIHDNQDGILANAGPGTVSISGSEIDHNGAGDGASHNLYIGEVASLTVTDSYIHDALGGHEIKSRADQTTITDNRIQDQSSNGNFAIDIPQGGATTITGNVLQKGADTQNWVFIHFGGEDDPSYANSALTVSNNTFINDLPAGDVPYFLLNDSTRNASPSDGDGSAYTATVTGNTAYGFGTTTQYASINPAGSAAIPVYDRYGPADAYAANVLLPQSAAPALDTSSPFAVPEPAGMAMLYAMLAVLLVLGRIRPLGWISLRHGTGRRLALTD